MSLWKNQVIMLLLMWTRQINTIHHWVMPRIKCQTITPMCTIIVDCHGVDLNVLFSILDELNEIEWII